MDEWVEIRVSRTGRLASLEVETEAAQEILAPGAFTQLSLPLNLYLGGAPSPDMYSPKMKTNASLVGCVQQVVINRREVSLRRIWRRLFLLVGRWVLYACITDAARRVIILCNYKAENCHNPCILLSSIPVTDCRYILNARGQDSEIGYSVYFLEREKTNSTYYFIQRRM